MNKAPIALFVFNRPEHTAATLQALGQNEHAAASCLHVFCDGPRTEADQAGVDQVRRLAKQATGFRQVHVVERESNLGLARSIITGVSDVLGDAERVIVVEDDLVTSPWFLAFLNAGLDRYADEERVISICGYAYPSDVSLPPSYFLPGAHCWGWATWRRGWAEFETDGKAVMQGLLDRNLLYEFDVEGSFPHTHLLQRTLWGEGDSWALRWMGGAIVHDRVTLYPGESLVRNVGMDDSGTHAESTQAYDTTLGSRLPPLPEPGTEVDRSALASRRRFHIRLRSSISLRYRLYRPVLGLLPRRLEKAVYTARVKRFLD